MWSARAHLCTYRVGCFQSKAFGVYWVGACLPSSVFSGMWRVADSLVTPDQAAVLLSLCGDLARYLCILSMYICGHVSVFTVNAVEVTSN